VVQELLVGGDLYNALQTTTFNEEDTITIVTQTLLALKFLHDQNIVHRDIKSDNILLLKNEQKRGRIVCKICDFGLSSYIDPNIGGLHGFAGTPEYMAPEVILQPGNKTEIRSRQADAKRVPVIT
jgi:serine/threonine protein kinase